MFGQTQASVLYTVITGKNVWTNTNINVLYTVITGNFFLDKHKCFIYCDHGKKCLDKHEHQRFIYCDHGKKCLDKHKHQRFIYCDHRKKCFNLYYLKIFTTAKLHTNLPVGSCPLGREIHAVWRNVLIVHNFTETKISNFNLAANWPTTK